MPGRGNRAQPGTRRGAAAVPGAADPGGELIMAELIRMSAAEIAAAVRGGEVSAAEVTGAHLARIEQFDGRVRAFLHVAADEAREAARAVDRRRAAGEELGPLAGVPLALKDVFTTVGMPTTCGSAILDGWFPPYDATITRRQARSSGRWPGSRWRSRTCSPPSACPPPAGRRSSTAGFRPTTPRSPGGCARPVW